VLSEEASENVEIVFFVIHTQDVVAGFHARKVKKGLKVEG